MNPFSYSFRWHFRCILSYDLVDLTRQALAKYANELFLKVIEAYQVNDVHEVAHCSQKFLDLVEDMDTLLACHEGFLLGPWLESAKHLAQDEEQEIQVRNLSNYDLSRSQQFGESFLISIVINVF